jgi:transmembrane sensor
MSSGKVLNFPERSLVEEEAAVWVVRLDDEDASEALRAEFEAWRQRSPAHADAYTRMRAHWRELDSLAVLSIGDRRAPAPRATPGSWMAGGLVAAACLVVAAVIGVQAMRLPSAPAPVVAQVASLDFYATGVGDQQRLTLSDGSVVTLNTASQIEVRMGAAERSIRLIEGEAFFEVAHDAARPFKVYARDGVTVAVGTAFSVRLHDDGVEVLVSEGKVSFASLPEAFAPEPDADRAVEPVAYISAGQSATFSNRIKLIETVEPAEVTRKLAWREGRIAFEGEPLSSVVADISRYTGVEIEIADPELASLSVGGLFEVGDVDNMLAALEASFDLKVEHIDATHVRLSRASP